MKPPSGVRALSFPSLCFRLADVRKLVEDDEAVMTAAIQVFEQYNEQQMVTASFLTSNSKARFPGHSPDALQVPSFMISDGWVSRPAASA